MLTPPYYRFLNIRSSPTGLQSAVYARALDSPGLALSINLTDPKDVIALKGQSATLRCDARSSLNGLEVTWLHNGSPLPPNDTRWSQREDGSLYILKVLSGKKANGVTGEYQCLVRNKVGAMVSGVAKLRVASMDRDFTKNPNNLSVLESQPAVLPCSIHSVPPAEIQWEFNDQPLPQHTRYVPLPNGALLLSKTLFSDAGSYRCKATNNILNVTKHSKTALLAVSPPSTEIIPLTFLPLDISPNSTVHVDEDLKLYCAVMGWPTPTVQWLNKDGVVLDNSTILRVNTTKARQSDNYTCAAYNSIDHVRKTFRIEVHQKPHFNVTPISKSYPAAQTVRLDCQAYGTPEPKIFWLKDGRPLTHDTRIKKLSTGLVFSHTFNSDSGIYQCVAVNPVGKIWTAAQIEINVSLSPRPPENVQCRPYDSTTICLSWQPPPNVSAQAYSVHSFYKADGLEMKEVRGPEYVTNMTHCVADGLSSSTNYTFYVRLYSKAASDRSEKVLCETGVKGSRNLDIVPVNADSVSLKWAEISTDVPCDGAKVFYKVQWKREGHSTINVERTPKRAHVISGLLPGTNYEFRVTSTSYNKDTDPWTPYTHSKMDGDLHVNNEEAENTTGGTDTAPVHPGQLEGVPVSPTSIKLSWTDISQKKFYTVCYVPVKEEKKCDDGELLKSYSNKLVVSKLKSNTTYEFKVRTHNLEGASGPFSKSIEVQTPADVPSSVVDLKYKIVNESTICLRWKTPAYVNGKLQNYVISYTPDRDQPLEKWRNVTVPSYQRKSTACWLGEQDTVSSLLGNLTIQNRYTVLVRAISDVGIGKPTTPIQVTTNVASSSEVEASDEQEIEYHKKVGVIVGVIMALVCIACCITCILVRRRCLKRRALARARMASSNNYYPAVAHYTSNVGSVQVRLEDPCATNVQERQHLVAEGHSTHIPPVSTNHLDTKGGEEFPNGHVNGSAKPYMNGHLSNGHVHITENPQYYTFECNGHGEPKKSKRPPKLRYREDSNSNVKSSKFYDLYRLFEGSKKSNPNYHQCNPHFDTNESKLKKPRSESLELSEDISMNDTQLTCLDDSLGLSVVNSDRRISPILGPNG
ncbi:hypothetical protein NQ315_005266 [Exocentrus adspersus]|uniref:Uncharacterized protein n=1 Tax=Exocentrus adspersus TaxID=1586481 RepID=A0AAV8W222_9CUCU|nr:hypothetical protein NQ315_005266 [Exocentrus adspersus]